MRSYPTLLVVLISIALNSASGAQASAMLVQSHETPEGIVRLQAPSEGVPVTATIDLSVSTTLPAHYVLIEPDWDAALPDELEIQNADSSISAGREGAFVTYYTLTLVPLAPGVYEIGPVELAFTSLRDQLEPISVTTDAIEVTVESILEGDTDLADIKDPFAPPPDYTKIALIAGGSALALGVLIAGAVLVARRRPESVAAPPEPAHNVAFSEIDALLASDLIATRQWMRYFGELSAITRRYIERRFDLHAPTQTTEEFLRDLHMQHLFKPEHDRLLRSFLMQSDVVKFAEGATDAHQATEAASRIRTFVEETKREERPA